MYTCIYIEEKERMKKSVRGRSDKEERRPRATGVTVPETGVTVPEGGLPDCNKVVLTTPARQVKFKPIPQTSKSGPYRIEKAALKQKRS